MCPGYKNLTSTYLFISYSSGDCITLRNYSLSHRFTNQDNLKPVCETQGPLWNLGSIYISNHQCFFIQQVYLVGLATSYEMLSQPCKSHHSEENLITSLTTFSWYTSHDDCFRVALVSALEQIHCTFAACDSKWVTVYSTFWISTKVYLQCCLVVTWVVPCETAAPVYIIQP